MFNAEDEKITPLRAQNDRLQRELVRKKEIVKRMEGMLQALEPVHPNENQATASTSKYQKEGIEQKRFNVHDDFRAPKHIDFARRNSDMKSQLNLDRRRMEQARTKHPNIFQQSQQQEPRTKVDIESDKKKIGSGGFDEKVKGSNATIETDTSGPKTALNSNARLEEIDYKHELQEAQKKISYLELENRELRKSMKICLHNNELNNKIVDLLYLEIEGCKERQRFRQHNERRHYQIDKLRKEIEEMEMPRSSKQSTDLSRKK